LRKGTDVVDNVAVWAAAIEECPTIARNAARYEALSMEVIIGFSIGE
jgi:hypothetical protein